MKKFHPFSALLTDLYQLTMAQGYWKLGKHLQPAVFDLFFREHPFAGGYTIFCGLQSVLQMVADFAFTEEDIAYLETLQTAEGSPLFQQDFLLALLNLSLSINIDAIEEGSVVFPKEPLLRVEGPLWECQLLETLLLNLVNFPTLIATKAARICFAAQGEPVIEFGLRRAQGPDGGLTASRAAYVGGASATSNVLAGKEYGIPVVGTHAHSWVMAFDNEEEAFSSYAKIMPENCILLVDTFNTLQGVSNAIQVGLQLKRQDHHLLGIRLDSGDLAKLSMIARQLLNEAGLHKTEIVASNDLDEYAITKLKQVGAKVDRWGVGTHLVTGYDQPALGGVYKLVAIKERNTDKSWQFKSKQSDDPLKKTISGIHQVRRFSKGNYFVRDVLYNSQGIEPLTQAEESQQDLLIPVVRQGKPVYQSPTLSKIRDFAQQQLQQFPEAIRLLQPQQLYNVELQGND